jgi:hypothetical protein
MIRRALALATPALLAPLAFPQQHVCEGNGLAPLSIAVSPAYLGGTLEIDLAAPTAPGGVVLLAKANAVGPVFHPLLGWGCLDVFTPGLELYPLPLDGAGQTHLSLALPPEPALVGAPPIFLSPALPTPLGIALGKTVPIHWTFPDSWSPAGSLPVARGFLQATALGDGPEDDRIDVFLSGGGDMSIVEPGSKSETWIYHPLTRTFEAGPALSVPRNFHTQTKLADGRVLILGGCDAQGVCHASGEIYDHDTGQLTPIAPMTAVRAGHAATLLDDGRVLVTGGLADFQNALTELAAALDTAQDTAEIYDPATDSWQPVPGAMASPRSGHGQVRWHDGRILILLGIQGGYSDGFGQTASFTSTSEWFEPLSETFSAAPTTIGSAFFGTSFLPSGELVAAGGLEFLFVPSGGSQATSRLRTFDGTSWTANAMSTGAAAYPVQATLPDGRILVAGGFVGDLAFLGATSVALATDLQDCVFDFLTFSFACGSAVAPIGVQAGGPSAASPRGGHAMVELFDGTFLVVGGMHGSAIAPVGTWALADAWIYAP